MIQQNKNTQHVNKHSAETKQAWEPHSNMANILGYQTGNLKSL